MKVKKTFTFIDLFAGIGGIRLAFDSVGGKCVFTSESDKFAQRTYETNFEGKCAGDISLVDVHDIPKHDVLLAGFPCQPFSHAGLKEGFADTRGTLFFEIERIIHHHQPKVVLLENVKGLKSHDKGRTFLTIVEHLEAADYWVTWEILNAKDFGLPQNRERIYVVAYKKNTYKKDSFIFPTPPKSPTTVGKILEKKVPTKYTISDRLWAGHQRRLRDHRLKGNGFGYSLFSHQSQYTSTISARYYKDGSEVLIQQRNKNPRKITPREAARLQGFPEWFVVNPSDTQAYKQFGNSVAVPVVTAIAKKVKNLIQTKS